MQTKTNKQPITKNVIKAAPLKPVMVEQDRSIVSVKKDRWPDAVLARGYAMVPSILLWGQARLGLKPEELNVLLQLISHWWVQDQNPHPAKETIARRMGKDKRTVQRHLTSLESKGLISRKQRFKLHKGQDSNGYDLSGLVRELKKIAPEFEKVTSLNKRRRAKTEGDTAEKS